MTLREERERENKSTGELIKKSKGNTARERARAREKEKKFELALLWT